MAVLSDIEIARENSMAPIEEIASKLDLKDQNLQKFGHHIAKIDTQIKKEIDDGIIAMPDSGEFTREVK